MDAPKKRSPGRPRSGETPKRNIRIGKVWDDAETIAHAHGETMTTVVKRLLENYVRRHRRGVSQPPVALPPPRLPADYGSYSERKPYTVADSLDDLRGPTSGVVELPHRLDWSGTPSKDLDEPGMLGVVYETVLNEASTAADLNTFLNRDALIELWPTLWLPPKVRRLWHERFPELTDLNPVAL